jgi:hypothetical protein
MKKATAKLYEMKIGQKFYYHYDNGRIIFVLKDCEIDDTRVDWIKFTARIFKTQVVETHTIQGHAAREQEYYLYNGRDRGSFMAGFHAAAAICKKHMGVFDIENAGIGDGYFEYDTMMKSYTKWKRNEVV